MPKICRLLNFPTGFSVASTILCSSLYPFTFFQLVSFSFPDLIWDLFWQPLQQFERVLWKVLNWTRWRTLPVLREWIVQGWWTNPISRWGAVTFGIQLAIVLFPLLRTLDSDGEGKIFTDCNLRTSEEKSRLPNIVPLRNVLKVNFHWTWAGVCRGLWFRGTNSGSVEIATECRRPPRNHSFSHVKRLTAKTYVRCTSGVPSWASSQGWMAPLWSFGLLSSGIQAELMQGGNLGLKTTSEGGKGNKDVSRV